jgi:hypothetical protein
MNRDIFVTERAGMLFQKFFLIVQAGTVFQNLFNITNTPLKLNFVSLFVLEPFFKGKNSTDDKSCVCAHALA